MKIKNLFVSICLLITVGLSVQAQDFDSKLSKTETDLMNGNNEQVLSECKSLIETGEADSVQQAILYCYAGLASEQLHKPADAINYYKKSIQLNVPRLDIYDRLIKLTKKSGNDADYEFALLEKRRAFPDFQESIVKSLAYLYQKSKQYDKLLDATNDLVKWFPNNTTFLNFQGIAYQNLGQIDKAESAYKEVLKLEPNHSYANMGIGMILYNKAGKLYDKKVSDYNALSKPSRVDYSNYRKALEEPKSIYREALPYLLKAYGDKSYASSLKGILFKAYTRLEEKEKAAQYK